MANLAAGAAGAAGADYADGDIPREQWTMPPLALLRRPEWSMGRKVAMLGLQAYLIVSVIILVVKAAQLAGALSSERAGGGRETEAERGGALAAAPGARPRHRRGRTRSASLLATW